MIVREKAPRYIALTWQEFCAHIQHNGGWMPRDGVVMDQRNVYIELFTSFSSSCG